MWLAADAILVGDRPEAIRLLEQTQMSTVKESHQFLRRLIDAMLELGDGGQASFARVQPLLKKAVVGYPLLTSDRELSRIYRQFVKQIARSRPGMRGWLWCLRERW